MITLKSLAEKIGGKLHGNPDCEVTGVATLNKATSDEVCFLADSRYRKHLSSTSAAVVILTEELLKDCPVNAIVVNVPDVAYVHAIKLIFPQEKFAAGIHSSASIGQTCIIDKTVWVGPHVSIEDGVTIESGCYIGSGTSIGKNSRIGQDSYLAANVSIYHGTVIGERALIHSGAVIGADGFGFANDKGQWLRIPQLGGVRMGNDVEVGASTTIDRGAIEDTVIGNGVKLDNLIQVAHNVQIGDNTAIAACTGISGSVKIGKRCTLAGQVGVAGHLELGDDVHITGKSLITKSILKPGVYSSGPAPAEPQNIWRRTIVRYRQLDDMANRLAALEKQLNKSDK
ncbi:MAG: UDP-3-O-(3-hydroxymyristoyl)glucosamine N-acyltransferase [Gammaproteobacteria bacterium]|nr:UDP-3-O-(3-hydroxymyristoyl)glucosamine N-acyltransferase [Gammaproteobacteria bacterium]